jgi:D-beta-D-heptose 7-phosphate kinase/D-beta-D-heptose 1-phosphate adenosyltransferase
MNNNPFRWLDSFAGLKVLVIGEAMLDRYLKGATHRLSQEAPVQVVNVQEKEDLPGGAANTAANIRSLGGEPLLLSVVGDDEEGKALRDSLKKFGISDQYVLADASRTTLAKQRVLANGQMMIRFDQGSTGALSAETEAKFIRLLCAAARKAQAMIVSDYNYGILTPNVLKAIADLQQRNPRVLVVDAKNYLPYQGLRVTAVKPNYAEAIKILKLEKKNGTEARISQMEKYGRRILEMANAQIAAITLDQDGALFLERGRPPYRIYARPAEHNRVAGAGDTFISVLALALAAGAETNAAAELASAGAAIVVEKPGTSTCYIEELKAYFSGDQKYITDNFHMAALVTAYRRQGKRIVFTNGCFDILHSGHIQYLNQAKSLGDVLIVGINSDDGVRRLKGENRPINLLEERAQVLSALSSVDHIIPFDEDIPLNLIQLIRPDIYAKGGDYTRDMLPEAALVEQQGGAVSLLSFIENHSTSGLIERIREVYAVEALAKEPKIKAGGQKPPIPRRKIAPKETASLK